MYCIHKCIRLRQQLRRCFRNILTCTDIWLVPRMTFYCDQIMMIKQADQTQYSIIFVLSRRRLFRWLTGKQMLIRWEVCVCLCQKNLTAKTFYWTHSQYIVSILWLNIAKFIAARLPEVGNKWSTWMISLCSFHNIFVAPWFANFWEERLKTWMLMTVKKESHLLLLQL